MATSRGGRRAQGQHPNPQSERIALVNIGGVDLAKFKPEFDKYPEGMPLSKAVERMTFVANQDGQPLPDEMEHRLVDRADHNRDGRLTYDEFVQLMTVGEGRDLTVHLTMSQKLTRLAISSIVPQGAKRKNGEDLVESYTDHYNCRPPPFIMIAISLAQIGVFVGYAVHQANTYCIPTTMLTGAPRYTPLIYEPARRYEAWRFATYMFIHEGIKHILFNMIFNLMLGVPLEMVHKWWRVGIIYILGVVAGSLASSITDPRTLLCGASGGCYALIGAQLAVIIMNWKDMTHDWMEGPVKFIMSAPCRLAFWLLLVGVDVGVAIYQRYGADVHSSTSYAAHFGGALTGVLLGMAVLRNFTEYNWEKVVKWIGLALYLVLIVFAVLFNIFYKSYYPSTDWNPCCYVPRTRCTTTVENATFAG